MASAIAEGVMSQEIETKVMFLKGTHRSNVALEILEAGALVVGSPTINDGIFPTVIDCMSYIQGLKRKRRR